MEPERKECLEPEKKKLKKLNVPPGTTLRYYGWSRSRNNRAHRGVVTCASRVHQGRVWLGLAWCSPKDQFSRVAGRNLALERLYDDPVILPFLASPLKAQEEFIAAACLGKVPRNSEIFIVPPQFRVPSWAWKWYQAGFGSKKHCVEVLATRLRMRS